MTQLCKLELQTHIKSSPSIFYDIYSSKTSLQPKIVPRIIRSIQVLEGDGKSVGTVRLWTYVMGNHPVITKDRIDYVDEQKKRITFEMIGGDITKHFKSFKATLEANVDTKIVKWTLEYEKANEDVAAPIAHLHFLVTLAKEVDSYLIKEQK